MTGLHQSKAAVWGLFLVFCAIWFYALGARTLVPADEGRYAEMAREMAATGDWITPRLNGIKYLEKPPLQTWMTALAFRMFGLGEWQARLWTGLCGLFGVVLTAYTGRRLFNRRIGFHAGLVLASSFMWTAMGHFNALDMGLAAMMTLSLCALLLAQRNDASPGARLGWMLVCWAGMALAVLSKGLIGVVLPGLALALYMLAMRDWTLWKRLHLGVGLLLFLAIAAPWFILVSLENPEFPHYFFIHEHVARFTSNIHRREGAWHYFIPVLLLGSVPWVGLLPQSLWRARHDARPGFRPKILLLIWTGLVFFFFSVSGSKLPSYILPLFPALALLVACHLEQASPRAIAISAGLVALFSAAGLAYAPGIEALATTAYEQPLYRAYMIWVLAGAAVGLTGSLLTVFAALRQKPYALVALAATGFLSSQILMLGHEPLGRYKAGLDHVPAIRAELTAETPIYSVLRYEQSLPFYLRRTLILVGDADEMAFGLRQEPHLWLPTLESFVEKWRADHATGKKSIAILRPDVLAYLKTNQVPHRIIAQDPRRVVVTNAPKNGFLPKT